MDVAAQIMLALAVPGVLAAMLWWLQRRGMVRFTGASSSCRMQVIERLPLTAQHSLHLVRVGDRTLVVGTAPGGCTLIGPVGEAE